MMAICSTIFLKHSFRSKAVGLMHINKCPQIFIIIAKSEHHCNRGAFRRIFFNTDKNLNSHVRCGNNNGNFILVIIVKSNSWVFMIGHFTCCNFSFTKSTRRYFLSLLLRAPLSNHICNTWQVSNFYGPII